MAYKGIELTDGTDILSTLPIYVPNTGDDSSDYSSFDDIPSTPGFYTVVYLNDADSSAPVTGTMNAFWIVMQLGPPLRMAQIATNIYAHDSIIYNRYKHDTTWYSWKKLGPTSEVIKTFRGTVTTPSIAANSGAVISLASNWPSNYSEILSVAVVGYWPKNTWSSFVMWNAPNINDRTVYVQNVGSVANSYDLTYQIVYRV